MFVSAAVALLWTFGATLRTLLDVGLVVAGLVPAAIRATPSLYLKWVKSRFWVANMPATWELSARFEQFHDGSTVESVLTSIRKIVPDSSILAQSQTRIVVRTRRFVLEISEPVVASNASENEENIALSVAPVTVGYRDSRRVLEHQLLPLVEAVRNDLGARMASYGLRVDLPEQNPYLGLYFQSFKTIALQEFRVQFALPTSAATKVVVGKERVTVISDALEQFRQAIAAALAFRVPEG